MKQKNVLYLTHKRNYQPHRLATDSFIKERIQTVTKSCINLKIKSSTTTVVIAFINVEEMIVN